MKQSRTFAATLVAFGVLTSGCVTVTEWAEPGDLASETPQGGSDGPASGDSQARLASHLLVSNGRDLTFLNAATGSDERALIVDGDISFNGDVEDVLISHLDVRPGSLIDRGTAAITLYGDEHEEVRVLHWDNDSWSMVPVARTEAQVDGTEEPQGAIFTDDGVSLLVLEGSTLTTYNQNPATGEYVRGAWTDMSLPDARYRLEDFAAVNDTGNAELWLTGSDLSTWRVTMGQSEGGWEPVADPVKIDANDSAGDAIIIDQGFAFDSQDWFLLYAAATGEGDIDFKVARTNVTDPIYTPVAQQTGVYTKAPGDFWMITRFAGVAVNNPASDEFSVYDTAVDGLLWTGPAVTAAAWLR